LSWARRILWAALAVLVIGACARPGAAPYSVAHEAQRFGVIALPNTGPAVSSPSTAMQVPTWYIDPQATVPTASDNNDCQTAATPCLTWGQIVARWGTYRPRLRQNTTVTFLSSQSGNSDPVYWDPYCEAGAWALIQGSLGAAQQIATGTLSNVTAKNRATPQLLLAQSGATATNQLVVNATHPSTAWTYALNAGSIYKMTQPLATQTIPFASIYPAEVDTWANGDSVTVYAPVQVNIAETIPSTTDFSASFNNALYISSLWVLAPQASSDWRLNNLVNIRDVVANRSVLYQGGPLAIGPGWVGLISNAYLAMNSGVPNGLYPAMVGGAIAGTGGEGAIDLDADVIVGASFTTLHGSYYGLVDVESGQQLRTSGLFFQSAAYAATIFWGSGVLNAQATSRFRYPSGAGAAATTFKVTGGLQLNGQSGAWLVTTAGSVPNKTLSAANLDTDLGATTGCYMNPGGASICNGAP
jgi:hypothetical protein